MGFIKSHPVVAGVIGVDILAIIIAISVVVFRSLQSAQLEILTAPTSAVVTINGRKYENGTFPFFPGEYTAKIEAEGMESKEKKIELTSGHTTRLYEFLTGVDSDFSYYETNDNDRLVLQRVGKDDEEVKGFLERYGKIKSIEQVLPLIYSEEGKTRYDATIVTVRRGTVEECSSAGFCLAVRDVPGGRLGKAIEMIKEKGFNPDDYKIVHIEGAMER